MKKRSLADKGLTLRSENRKVLVGTLRRDRLGWTSFVQIGTRPVLDFVADELAKIPEGEKVRLIIEVMDEH